MNALKSTLKVFERQSLVTVIWVYKSDHFLLFKISVEEPITELNFKNLVVVIVWSTMDYNHSKIRSSISTNPSSKSSLDNFFY